MISKTASRLLVVLLALVVARTAVAEEPEPDPALEGPISILFAQSAESMSYDGSTLTLQGLAPATLFFAERPQRLSGHLTTEQFVALWAEGGDDFKADPPNAALSILADGAPEPVVVELTSVAQQGESLTYGVRVLEGSLPESAGPVSLFIDPFVWVPPRRFVRAAYRRHWINCYWSYYLHRRICHRVYY